MKKMLFSVFILLALGLGVPSLSAAHSSQDYSEHCKQDAQCPKKFTLPCVNVAKTPVQKKGSLVFNCKDKRVYYSDGNDWVPLEPDQPAPQNILVDPAICPNGVTKFNTIQDAIDSLGSQQILDTTIQIAKGTYPENVVVHSLLNTFGNNLKLVGDTRQVSGCGFAHSSAWNPSINLTPVGLGPVGGGKGVIADFSASTLTSITVKRDPASAAGTLPPDFGAAGVVPGDQIIIRDITGAMSQRTVTSVSTNTTTNDTINFTPALTNPANGLHAAMTVAPNVVLRPPTGSTFTTSVDLSLQGLWFNIVDPVPQSHINITPNTAIYITNLLIHGNGIGILPIDVAGPGGTPNNGISSVVWASNVRVEVTTTQGISLMIPAPNNTNSYVGVFCEDYCDYYLINSLLATTAAGPRIFEVQNKGTLRLDASRLLSGNTRNVGQSIGGFIGAYEPTDMICMGGMGLQVLYGTLEVSRLGSLTIKGAPTVGIRISQGASIKNFASTPLSLQSTAASFIGLQIGFPGAFGDTDICDVTTALANLVIPAGSSSYIAQVSNGSRLEISNITGTHTIGANSNGFLVQNGSQLIFGSAATAGTGNISGNAASVSGILFDIENGSELIYPPGATRTFTNYPTIFKFNDRSVGNLNNVTCTTTPGGTNLLASNMSRVEIDTATFNLSGANVGITASFGAFVGKKGGAVFTNSAATPISSCNFPTNVAQNTYTCTYDDGLVVVSP